MQRAFSSSVVLAVFVALVTRTIHAQVGSWEQVHAPGGFVIVLAVDPLNPSNVYAGVDRRLYVSTDGGRTWILRQAYRYGQVNALHFRKHDPSILFISSSGTAWTKDGGTTGRTFTEAAGIDIQTHPTNPLVIAIDNLISYDGGRTFSRVGPSFAKIAVDPADDRRLIAYKSGEVTLSTDGGLSWSATLAAWGDVVRFDPALPGVAWFGASDALYRSSDGGVSWVPAGPADVNGISWSSGAQPEMFLAKTKTPRTGPMRVYKSSDGGSTFEPILSPEKLPDQSEGNFVRYGEPVVAGNRILVPLSNGIVASEDGGKTWSYSDEGIDEALIGNIVFDPANPSRGFASTYSAGLMETMDGGLTWSRHGYPPDCGTHLHIDPTRPGLVLCASRWPFGNGGLWRSEDFGDTWTSVAWGSAWYATRSTFDPTVGNLLIPGDENAFLSVDGGKSFKSLRDPGSGLPGWEAQRFYAVSASFGKDGAGYMAFLENSDLSIFRTFDGGVSWSKTGTTFPSLDWNDSTCGELHLGCEVVASPTDTDLVIAFNGEAVERSTDGGSSWVRIPDLSIAKLAFDPGSDAVFALSENLMLSPDGGESWSTVPWGGKLDDDVRSIGVRSDGKVVFASYTNGGMYALGLGGYSIGGSAPPTAIRYPNGDPPPIQTGSSSRRRGVRRP